MTNGQRNKFKQILKPLIMEVKREILRESQMPPELATIKPGSVISVLSHGKLIKVKCTSKPYMQDDYWSVDFQYDVQSPLTKPKFQTSNTGTHWTADYIGNGKWEISEG